MKKIIIYGIGQLGNLYAEYLSKKDNYEVKLLETNINDEEALARDFTAHKPDIVINTAAYTDIDWCERNKSDALQSNTIGADNVAKYCLINNAYFVHISSGCVQESKNEKDIKTEEDMHDPVCFYSWTKAWADELIMDKVNKKGLKALIIRPRQLMSDSLSPRNAFIKMLTYKKFIDVKQSATVIEDLLSVTEQLIIKDATGIINVANPGLISPYLIANMLKEIINPEMEFEKINKEELNKMTYAQRIDCVLSTDKLQSYGIKLEDIQNRAREIINRLNDALSTKEGKEVLEKTNQETLIKLSLKK